MRIARLVDEPDRDALPPAIEEIFFATSAVRSFADRRARDAFKERWLGRYLAHYAQNFFVARAGAGAAGEPIGYLAGCLESPALNPRFEDIGFYRVFAPLCAFYPSHLHVNVVEPWRSRGIGAQLIAAFAAQALQSNSPGMHIVTDHAARNVRFYQRNAFRILSTQCCSGSTLVFMGRQLAAPG